MTILKTTVSHPLKKKTLLKGTLIATFGGGLLLLSGTLIPPPTLNQLGLPLFLISLALITFGLLPYKKLLKLEKNPHQIHLMEQGFFIQRKGYSPKWIPWSLVSSLQFKENKHRYGILVTLHQKTKNTPKEKNFLFLPFFTRYAYHEMLDCFLVYET